MTVKVLGACCKNCNTLTENVRKALAELRVDCPVEKVTDLGEIMRYGVMSIRPWSSTIRWSPPAECSPQGNRCAAAQGRRVTHGGH